MDICTLWLLLISCLVPPSLRHLPQVHLLAMSFNFNSMFKIREESWSKPEKADLLIRQLEFLPGREPCLQSLLLIQFFIDSLTLKPVIRSFFSAATFYRCKSHCLINGNQDHSADVFADNFSSNTVTRNENSVLELARSLSFELNSYFRSSI